MKNSAFVKKIVAGKYKNIILNIPSKNTTRSSKNIVLESFFNTISFDIVDSVFVELFGGSGSIGLEALSRGAKKVYFFERDKEAIFVLKSNIAKTDPSSCEVIAGDTFLNIKTLPPKIADEKAIFYIDPPFSIRDGMRDIYDKTISLVSSLKESMVKLIIFEHMSMLDLPENIGTFSKIKTRKFGNTSLTYYK